MKKSKPFSMPATWQWVPFGSCARLINGRAYKQSELLSSGTPVLRIQNLNKGDRWYYSNLSLPADKYCQEGDLLYAWSATFGPYLWAGQRCIYHYHIWKIEPKPHLDKLFGYYLLQWISKAVKQAAHGITMVHMTKEGMESWLVPLPPLDEQRRIAAILDKADAVRRKRQEAIALTEELLRSAFLEMFGDPEHSPYSVKGLAEVCELITDGAHFTPTYVENGVPFLRVTDIQTKSIDWVNTKCIPIEEHRVLIKRCHPRRGDVLYSKNGTIGIPKLVDWDEEFSIFVSLALLRPKADTLLGGYLESFLKTPFALRQAISHTKTGTVSNLHLVEIRKVKLPVPSLEMQREWLTRKSEIEKQRDKLIESSMELNNLFNSILQRAFRGEL